ncbi:MarR family winged helix-turn-helix transcriptional regulator [Butyrivibrio sp. VCD2006]|uniref:MarR family winged helix-turn-helix transcriptional regulator n=1 Tax=Butyrivibrio sp. VCD2006 TaxID=1280664 RepID=UPI00041C5312|nr:MarR family winged helix-turn-helix transcriptional regulator [Butyrivibrio sp. VCD2006]
MNKIDDMELMRKILKFTRKNRPMGPGKHDFPPEGFDKLPPNIPPMGEPHFERPPKPGFEGPGPHDEMPPFGQPPGHPGPHPMRKPPLSREHLLVLISECPEGIRQKALMEKAGIGQSSVSELINKLEDDGYVERKIDPTDKRATLLFLTEKGSARAFEVEDERKEFFAAIFSKLSDEEKQVLSDIMDKLLSE